MENKLTKIVAVLTVLGLMIAGPVAYADSQKSGPGDEPVALQAGPGDEGPGGGPGVGRPGHKDLFKDLNLTPEQKEKLKAQREAKKESTKALRDQLRTKMQALHETIGKPGTKPADVAGLVNELNVLKGQMFAQQIDGIFAMKQILTPEQFAKMQAQQKEWMQKKHEAWGKKDQGPKQN